MIASLSPSRLRIAGRFVYDYLLLSYKGWLMYYMISPLSERGAFMKRKNLKRKLRRKSVKLSFRKAEPVRHERGRQGFALAQR